MFLKNISLINFKNYAEKELEFINGINSFVGMNGVGKTNILDAVNYLSLCKSFINNIDSQNIKYEEEFFIIQGNFFKDNDTDTIYCAIKKNKKKIFKKNKKEYEKLSYHIGQYPIVVILPSDINIINEASEIRRKFIDMLISQFDNIYLNILIKYNNALQQRNVIIRDFSNKMSFNNEILEIWNEQLVIYGKQIHQKRKEILIELKPLFLNFYNFITDSKNEDVNFEYKSQLNEASFESLLLSNIDKDLRLQYTSTGIHRDDIEFMLNGYSLKKFSSQGQQKTFLICLKLAQYALNYQKTNIKPILLFDDIFDKLDDQRIQKIFHIIEKQEFGQVFITDTNAQRINNALENIVKDNKFFNL